MKYRVVAQKFAARAALAGSFLLGTCATAYAALPADVKTSVEGAKGDATEAGGLVIGVVVAIFGLMIIKGMFKGR
ncbi:major capsid protein [Chromobacterium haemolyticum]|uniref:major capsid protein n=1 Tax=Chromobacterium haemolyticum TaxID=394935 RepID=UPI00131773B0|nr:major capsid protein [Chromobacterium haemolyticum]BBH12973.1 hypothetical protein CH06BL_22210 [Chromobacterium haemolyticum]